MTDPDLAAAVAARCREVLEGSWREGEQDGKPYYFGAPSPGRYPWCWYWDSCFQAIVRRRIDPDKSRKELETILASSEEGFIGHIAFWGTPLNLERAIRYNIQTRRDHMTRTIQPPLLAWAWRMTVGDPRENAAIAQHHEWLTAHRDLDGDGLLWLIQPDESGLDASPKFDHVWGRYAQGRRGFPLLIHQNRKRHFDARRIRDDRRPVLCEVLTNVMWSLARQAMGQPSATPALVDRLWNESQGRFLDEAVHAGTRPAPHQRPRTFDTLAPLALPDLPEEIARRLIEETLFDEAAFWGGVPLPSVAMDDPTHTSRDHYWGLRRYWRGSSWANAAWLAWLGLKRLGYEDRAGDMATRLASTVAREGLREYYDSRTGAGMGAKDFGWTSLVWEMSEPAPGAERSYFRAA